MSKLELPPSEGLYPVPVVLVSCLDKTTQNSNIITIAWCGVVSSNPPQISVSVRPSRHSFKLIKDTGDFVVNVPTSDMVRAVDLCGIRSGNDVDKFKLCKFTKIPSVKVSSPMIKECPVNIECKLKNALNLGSHHMFIGEVLSIHVDKEITDGSAHIDFAKAKPFVYNHGEYWDMGKKIGFYGFSGK